MVTVAKLVDYASTRGRAVGIAPFVFSDRLVAGACLWVWLRVAAGMIVSDATFFGQRLELW